MRVVRPILGLLLGAVALVLLLAAGLGWQVAQHRDPDGEFSAELSPVHTDGYAIVVPDVAGAIGRHGLARLIDAGRVRISASSGTPLVLALVPAAEVSGFLNGVGRTIITGVGYGRGVQPVSVATITGTGVPPLLPQRSTWAVGADGLAWAAQTDRPVSLLVLRTDGKSGFTAALTVGLQPPAWGLPAGGLAIVVGLVLLIVACFLVRPGRRRRRERFVRVAPEYSEDASGWVVGAYNTEPEPPRPVDTLYVHSAT